MFKLRSFSLIIIIFVFISSFFTLFCPNAIAQEMDDYLEVRDGSDNDSYQNATVIDPDKYDGLKCIDDDWYRVNVPALGNIIKANLKVTIQFSHMQGDLDLNLYSTKGSPNDYNFLDISSLTANEEVVSASVPPGDYLIRIYGYKGAKNEYEMNIEILYPCQYFHYEWLDISDGEQIPLADDDYREISIGFDFKFYDQIYNTVKVSSNGYLTFAEPTNPYFNPVSSEPISAIHRNAPPVSIFSYWMNLRPDLDGGIFYKIDESNPECKRLIVEWRDVPKDTTGEGVTFQVVLFECTNQIQLQYEDVIFTSQDDGYSLGSGATIGITNGRKTNNSINRIATQYLYKKPLLKEHATLMFTPSLNEPLRIISSNLINEDQIPYLDQQINIIFSQHIDCNPLTGLLSINPFVNGEWVPNQNRIVFNPIGDPFVKDSLYEVTLFSDLRDCFGNTLFGDDDYTFSFRADFPDTNKPEIEVSPTSHNFGNVFVNETSTPLEIIIFNKGSAELEIKSLSLSDETNFSFDEMGGSNPLGNPPTIIPVGENRTITITFTPSSENIFDGSLTINSNDPNSPFIVSLDGNGIPKPKPPEPDIEVSPNSHNFGNVLVNETSTPLEIIIFNKGSAELEIKSLSLSDETNFSFDEMGGSNPLGNIPATISSGENRSILVTFNPDSENEFNTSLVIDSNDPDTPILSVLLDGEGIESKPDIAVSHEDYNFGNVRLGSSSTFIINISNNGNTDLKILGLNLSEIINFSLYVTDVPNQLGDPPATIPAGENRSILISFSPLAEDTFNPFLEITSDDPDTPIINIYFHGTGISTPKGWKNYDLENCFAPGDCLSSPIIEVLMLDANDILWIGSAGAGICAYNLTTGAFSCFDEDNGFAGNNFIDIALGPQGELWVATYPDIYGYGASLNRFISAEGMFESYNPTQMGMYDDLWINDIAVDSNNHLWIATTDFGLLKFDGVHWDHYALAGEIITSLNVDSYGRLWIGTLYNGLFVKEPSSEAPTGINLNFGDYLSEIDIDPNGNVWIVSLFGNENNLIFLNPDGFLTEHVSIPDSLIDTYINDMFIHPITGNLFIASDNGLYRYDGQDWHHYGLTNSGLPSLYVNSIIVDSYNDYWAGTEEGLSHYNSASPYIVGEVYGDNDRSDDLPIDTSIFIKFSEPMDRNSTELAFEMKDADRENTVNGSFHWNKNSTVIKFEPASSLAYNSKYEVRIYKEATDRAGMNIDLNVCEGDIYCSYFIFTRDKPAEKQEPSKKDYRPYTGFLNYYGPNYNLPYWSRYSIGRSLLRMPTGNINLQFNVNPYSSYRFMRVPQLQSPSYKYFDTRNLFTPSYYKRNIYQSYQGYQGYQSYQSYNRNIYQTYLTSLQGFKNYPNFYQNR